MSKQMKIGSFIMMGMSIFALVISILWLLVTDIMFVSDFYVFTGTTYADYLISDPVFAEFYIITKKLVGLVLCIASLQMLIVSKVGFEKGERWSWFTLLITGGLFWGVLLGYRAFIGYLGGSTITFVVGIILWILALLVPIREFFPKET